MTHPTGIHPEVLRLNGRRSGPDGAWQWAAERGAFGFDLVPGAEPDDVRAAAAEHGWEAWGDELPFEAGATPNHCVLILRRTVLASGDDQAEDEGEPGATEADPAEAEAIGPADGDAADGPTPA